VHVLCPSCSAENKVKVGREIVCGKCKTSLSGFVYSNTKRSILTAISALVIGAYGSYRIDQVYFGDARYPVKAEYAIIDSCVTSHRIELSMDELKSKKLICLCAFEKTANEIPYAEFKDNMDTFFVSLKKNASACK
jgi:hypothetical protein